LGVWIIKIIATTPGKRGALVFAAGLAVVAGFYWGIEKNSIADMLAGHDKVKKLADDGTEMVILCHDTEGTKRYPASRPGLEGICGRATPVSHRRRRRPAADETALVIVFRTASVSLAHAHERARPFDFAQGRRSRSGRA
jgi:hypothetical protein